MFLVDYQTVHLVDHLVTYVGGLLNLLVSRLHRLVDDFLNSNGDFLHLTVSTVGLKSLVADLVIVVSMVLMVSLVVALMFVVSLMVARSMELGAVLFYVKIGAFLVVL